MKNMITKVVKQYSYKIDAYDVEELLKIVNQQCHLCGLIAILCNCRFCIVINSKRVYRKSTIKE